jgi:hypothetical protein
MIRLGIILQYAMVALFVASAPATAKDLAVTEGETAALQLALDRGLAIYRYDQAAWHTTDTMLKDVKDPKAAGVRGWVVTKVDGGHLTTFWAPQGDGFRGVYSAIWTGSKVIDRKVLMPEESALTKEQAELIRARQAADANGLQRCGKAPFNTVVLPPEKAGDPILVYFLTPQTTLTSIPMGGHYRFAVKEGQILEQRGFTKSCLELPFGKAEGNKGKPEALMVSHLLDPVPTEIHVFSVFAAQLPIYVATASNNHLWSVEISGGQPRARVIK